jgi:hypothetical protein
MEWNSDFLEQILSFFGQKKFGFFFPFFSLNSTNFARFLGKNLQMFHITNLKKKKKKEKGIGMD